MINEWLPAHHQETPALKDCLLVSFINKLALKAGCEKIPFPEVSFPPPFISFGAPIPHIFTSGSGRRPSGGERKRTHAMSNDP
jgi:hypothetical protein